MSMTIFTGRNFTSVTCLRTGNPRIETILFFFRSFMAFFAAVLESVLRCLTAPVLCCFCGLVLLFYYLIILK